MKRHSPKRPGLMLLMGCLVSLLGIIGLSQENGATRQTVTLSYPSRPAVIKAVNRGAIEVESYNGKDVVVELRSAGKAPSRRDRSSERPDERKALVMESGGVKVAEADNVVSITLDPGLGPTDLWIQVPVATNLKLRNVDGEIRVAKVKGEFDLDSVNGNIVLADVSGTAVAHAVNGRLKADFTAITPDQAMSLATVNGDIEIAFPAELKAKVRLASVLGRITCDFAVEKGRTTRKGQLPELRGMTVAGLINGGGADIRVATVNGSIRIKKR